MTDKITYACPNCGSDHVYAEASVWWNILGQYWALSSPFTPEELHCGDCNHVAFIEEFVPKTEPTERLVPRDPPPTVSELGDPAFTPPDPPRTVPVKDFEAAVTRAVNSEAMAISQSIERKMRGERIEPTETTAEINRLKSRLVLEEEHYRVVMKDRDTWRSKSYENLERAEKAEAAVAEADTKAGDWAARSIRNDSMRRRAEADLAHSREQERRLRRLLDAAARERDSWYTQCQAAEAQRDQARTELKEEHQQVHVLLNNAAHTEEVMKGVREALQDNDTMGAMLIVKTFFAEHEEKPTMPDYASMDAPKMLQALGDDAMKWAEAFQQIIVNRGKTIDVSLMVGWFANAIETAANVRAKREGKA